MISSQPDKSEHNLVKKIQNNKLIQDQYKLINEFFGFDIGKASQANLQNLRAVLHRGTEGILAKCVKQEDKTFFAKNNFPQSLSEAEQNIFDELVNSFTLRHGTNALKKIRKTGKIQSVRSLKKAGLKVNRNAPSVSGLDSSIYSVLGMNDHEIPNHARDARHIITTNLTQMQQDSMAIKRLWVSGHLHDYEIETESKFKIGEVTLKTKHNKDLSKTYTFIFPDGETLEWKNHYQDEVFAGLEVAPGLALQFLYLLRLLGGRQNTLINNLYHLAEKKSADFNEMLSKLFSTILPGYVFPEAKIIGEMDLDAAYNSVSENKSRSRAERDKFSIVEFAVKSGDLTLLRSLLKLGYSCLDKETNLLCTALKTKIDPELKRAIFQELIAHGVTAMQSDRMEGSALEAAIGNGTADELDFLLSQEYPDSKNPLIKRLPNPNLAVKNECRDLVDLACHKDFSGEKLKILQKHGANFTDHSVRYLNSAINATFNYRHRANYNAIFFLANLKVKADDANLSNNTPLMNACSHGDFDLVRLLVEELGADVNARFKYFAFSLLGGKAFYDSSDNGKTALHVAAENGDIKIVKYLLIKGADAHLETVKGKKPFDVALEENHFELADLLNFIMKFGPANAMEIDEPSKKIEPPIGNPEFRKQAVATLLTGTREDGKRYVVLTRPRSDYETSNHYYGFPSGFGNDSDTSLQAAALRQVLEKTSVNVEKIPGTTITQLGNFRFDDAYQQAATFFLVDVGTAPIKVLACNDLIDAKKVLVEQLIVDKSKPIAQSMQINANNSKNFPVLGSHALFIDKILSNNNNPSLSIEEYLRVKAQLDIEVKGYKLLLQAIGSMSKDSKPGTAEWERVKSLLDNNAHLSHHFIIRESIAEAMMQVECFAGLELLKQYNVDITDLNEFKLNGDSAFGSPMLHAIMANRLDVVKYLASLDDRFFSHQDNISYLHAAAKYGCCEIMDYLLNRSDINPNASFEYEGMAGTLIVRPLITRAIHYDQTALMMQLLKDERLLLNRERSHTDRNTVLMSAIKYDKKAAIYTLLATGRLDLFARNIPNHDDKRKYSAIDLALKKKDLELINVIIFLQTYSDINDFLASNNLPTMDEFSHVLAVDGSQAIHFKSKDAEKIKILADKLNLKVLQKDGLFYLALGQDQLLKLFSSVGGPKTMGPIVEFLLNYTQDSILWSNRSPIYRDLHTQLVRNTLETIDADMLNVTGEFNSLENKPFYARLIKENYSLQELNLDLAYPNENVLNWLLDAIKNHDKITQAVLRNAPANEQIWQKTLSTLFSFKKLKSITCEQMSLPALLEVLTCAGKMDSQYFPKIIMSGYYKPEECAVLVSQIQALNLKNEIVIEGISAEQQSTLTKQMVKNQVDYFMQTDKKFRKNAEKFALSNLSEMWLGNVFRDSTKQKNYLLNRLAIQQSNPESLSISCDILQENGDDILDYLKNNTTIKSVGLNGLHSAQGFTRLMDAITASNMPLSHLSLSCTDFGDELASLTEVIKKHPIEMIDLGFAKFNCSEEAIAQFGAALAHNPNLMALDLNYSSFKDGAAQRSFLNALCQSKSLLTIGTKIQFADLNAAMRRNGDAILNPLSPEPNIAKPNRHNLAYKILHSVLFRNPDKNSNNNNHSPTPMEGIVEPVSRKKL